jgi:butyryl-CoA:acetate CoA-transferase
MNYMEEYKQKLTSADEAVKIIKSGDWVDYGWATGTPVELDKALAAHLDELMDINFRGGILLRTPEIFKIKNAGAHITWNSWHMSAIERKAVAEGFCYYNPIRYSELPRYYRDSMHPNDVAMFQVTPMDKEGFFNYGPNASHMTALCETSKKIIVEVNNNMPNCIGFENAIHISDVDLIVEGLESPISDLNSGAINLVDKAVAELIIDEIPSGACLQLGIGGMTNAIGMLIADSDLKDLGVHTEMYIDAFVDISNAGKISGSKKSIDPFRQTYAFGAGTKKLYDFLHNNPECMSAPVNYTNDIRAISSLDNFVSINNCVEVDLFGQVNSETIGTRHISGAGGQLDFVLGAYLSKGGKSFICCSSTYKTKEGEVKSRISPILCNGSVVTDTRTNIQYLVTEYGKVNLKGLSTWQRSEAIISIAHPDFREQLIKEAEKMKIWRMTNRIVFL